MNILNSVRELADNYRGGRFRVIGWSVLTWQWLKGKSMLLWRSLKKKISLILGWQEHRDGS